VFAQGGATPPPAGAAFADQEPAAGILAQQPAPLPPANTSCGAHNCITLELDEDALRAVEHGGDPAAFADGISFIYEGERPPAIHFVAARYRNGRLEQYQTTRWIRPDEAGADIEIEGVADAVTGAAHLSGRPPSRLTPVSGSEVVWITPVSMQGFVIDSPRTFLIGEAGSAPIDVATVAPEMAAHVEGGVVLFVAFVPSDVRLRAPEQTLGTGAVIPLKDGE
jgi:hypothetical protein